MKLMTIVGTRPEIIRLSETIKECDKCFEHILVHTGQNFDYELNEIFFDDLELRKPDYFLEAVGNNLGETIGNVISKSYNLMEEIKPDALLILGDTNSCLSALAAKRLKIPVFHMEAGNRCFDLNVPEETNRKLVDNLSDVNLAYTEHARRYLLSEQIKKEYVFVTGSPLPEVFSKFQDKIEKSNILSDLTITKNKFILVSLHREENIDIDKKFDTLVISLNAIAEHYQIPLIVSAHPRTANKIKQKNIVFNDLVEICKPFGFVDYNKLQKNAFCVLSDSGSLAEESSIMDFPAVSVRTSTERPEAIDHGNFILGGIDFESLKRNIDIVTNNENKFTTPVNYSEINVSKKVVKVISGYTRIVNEMIWRKNN